MTADKINPIALRGSEGVVELLKSSKTRQEWDENCKTIIAANSGRIPPFWYAVVSDLSVEYHQRFDEQEKKQKQEAEEADIQRQKDEKLEAERQKHNRVAEKQDDLRKRRVKLVIKSGP
jgi:hypothetical protein